MEFINLGIVTDYTLLKSLIKIDNLIDFAITNKISVLGIINDNLYSTMEFYTKCKKNNIKPIVGYIHIIDNSEIYFYPKNYQGLIDLFNNNYNTENIICVIPYQSKELYDKVGNKIKYISYNNETELKNALLITQNVVYINKIYSLSKEDAKYVNYLHMIDKGLTISNYSFNEYNDNIIKFNSNDFDISTTNKFNDLINLNFNNNKKYIPIYRENSTNYLRELSIKGLNKRLNNNIPDEYKKRLIYELNIINKMGYVDYFLIVYDYVKYAKNNDIMVGPGRGSAAGSLVSYSLGITEIDPIKYNLLFERFLNPDRITMPDIDIDFDALKRYKVVDYVTDKYGRDYVSNIMTYSTLSSKQVLRDVTKCLEIENNIIDNFISKIDAKLSLKENLTEEIKNIINKNSNLKNAYYIAIKLEGLKRQIGTHAAGIVISSEKLTNIIPIIKNDTTFLTGYTMEYLEELGLLKMDFLAIKDLSILDNIIKSIEEKINKKININQIKLDDKKTYEEFSKANTNGVFQFESNGMKNFLAKLKPSNFEDLIAALALFRPGPMNNIDTYIKRKYNKEKVTYPHPSLEEILKSTYGIIIYQEQIMQILSKMASYSYAESDLIRRAISKKKLNIIEEEKTKFINNSIKNGYTESTANEVYNLIVKFANYGFNKSHSVAYALIGYQMCFLKTHYPLYFYTSLLNFNIGSETKTKEYIDCLKKLNIEIIKPNINLSTNKYQIQDNKLLLPLNIIKNIGSNISEQIVNLREDKFIDYYDFIKKLHNNNINNKTIETLILSGSLDTFNINRRTLIENLDNIIDYAELSNGLMETIINKPSLIEYDEYNENELIQKEKELYGFYLSNHPITKYNNEIKLINIDKYFDKNIQLYVYIDNIKKIKTKNNQDMVFLSCSDETDKKDFIIFPTKYHLTNNINIGDIINIYGKVEKRLDKYQIIINNIKK